MEYLFKKYKSDCTVFFETGTHIGTAIQSAYDLGFERIVSIEIQERFLRLLYATFSTIRCLETNKIIFR
jgi:hypothetical protein